jgi:hypothetical protein
MAKSKEELEREIDRLLEQNKMTSSSSIPYGDNTDKFYESIKTKNKQEIDNQTRLRELQAQASRLKGNPESFSQYQRTVGQIDTLQARVSLDEVYRDERARTSFTEATKKAFSTDAIASDAAKFGRGAGQGEVHQLARQYTTSQLRQRLSEASVGVTQWGEHAQSIASEYSGAPDQKKEYMQMMSYRQQDIGRMSLLDQAMRAQKRMGIDVGSREESLEKFRGGFERDRMSQDISRDIATGKTGSINQEMKKLEEAAAKVTKALDAMSKATDRSDENLEKLATSAEEARSEYERQKETVGQMRSGGGGGGRTGRAISWMGGVGAGLSAAGQVGEGILINNEMGITSNRIAQVNLANSRANDILALSQGDMSAYRRITTDQYNRSVLEGLDMRNTSRVTTGLGVAGTLATGAAGAWAGAKLGAAGGAMVGGVGAVPGAIFGGILGGGAGIAAGAIGTHGALNDIQSDQVMLARTQQMNDLYNAMNMINDTSNQMGFDYRTGVTYATRGIGVSSYNEHVPGDSQGRRRINSGRNETARLMEQESTFEALKGLNAQERTSLLSYGVNAMGARMGGQRGIDMMASGQNMARMGMVRNAEEFIGMSAKLTGASGDEKTMLAALKTAFTEGLQGADVLQNIAGGIANLGSVMASNGSQMSESFAARYTSSVGTLANMGYDANQAAALAAKGTAALNASMTDTSLGWSQVVRTANLNQKLGTPRTIQDQLDRQALQKLEVGDYDKIADLQKNVDRAANPEEKQQALEALDNYKTLKGARNLSQKELDIGKQEAFGKVAREKTLFAGNDKLTLEVQRKIERGIPLANNEERNIAVQYDLYGKSVASSASTKVGSMPEKGVGATSFMEEGLGNIKSLGDEFVKKGLNVSAAEFERNTKIIKQNTNVDNLSKESKETGETGKVPEKMFSETFDKLQEIFIKNGEVLQMLQKSLSEGGVFDTSTKRFETSVNSISSKLPLLNNTSGNSKK